MICSATVYGNHFEEPLGHICGKPGLVVCAKCNEPPCPDHFWISPNDGKNYCVMCFNEVSRVKSAPITGVEWDVFLGKTDPEAVEE